MCEIQLSIYRDHSVYRMVMCPFWSCVPTKHITYENLPVQQSSSLTKRQRKGQDRTILPQMTMAPQFSDEKGHVTFDSTES